MAKCEVCFRHCEIKEGETGFCGGRTCTEGKVCADNYGRITSLALDPIEKKPLRRFHPHSMILSVGSYGCNLRCPFCQNYEISWSEQAMRLRNKTEQVLPRRLADMAANTQRQGNIGLAFTYNEPLIGYEFVRDTAKLIHEQGMVNVLVTNGMAELPVLEELLPWIDAMNIDLKGFTDHYYEDILGGKRDMVMRFIERCIGHCHVELTTLIVPGENDTEDEMRALSGYIAELNPEIPLHISRFFPRFHMKDRGATEVSRIYRLAGIAKENLRYVFTGNC